ncbi:hypothetical protein EPD60_15140 [Flaviaesturariibacter flavus]|uniref:Uncharacterized protein n=1 Tax=Flaviaesturariibacter flavus TaxID=2502780 RepID=A0A4R1B3X4_9BACT|nr:hypothetical protein [Flaviaesturariibacter flavus]TCJ12601.1 hypothetical protein EPD60_15140 [Flaviaesturariibacter flavus]
MLVALLPERLGAQSFNVIAPSAITVSTVAQLESSTITIPQAFSLIINSGRKKYDLAAIVTSTSPATSPIAAGLLQVRFNNITPNDNTGYTLGNIALGNTASQVLATKANDNNNNNIVARYDLILQPIGWAVPAGNYTFNLSVTYSENKNTSITRTIPITVNVQRIVALSLATGPSHVFTFATTGEFDAGKSIANGNSFTLKSNSPWIFTARSASSSFNYSGSLGPETMPASVLKVSVGSTEVALSTTPQTLVSGSATPGSSPYYISYRATPGYAYLPGTYTIALTYTLTAP